MIRAGRLAPGGIIAGNLAIFLVSSNWFLSGNPPLTHHWLLPFHEALLLGQAALLRGPWAVKPLTIASLIVLGVGAIRIESIYAAHHLVHFSITLGLAAILHGALLRRISGVWSHFNRGFASSCLLLAAASVVVALQRDIWWGMP